MDLRRDQELALRFPEEQKSALECGRRLEDEKKRVSLLKTTSPSVLLAAQVKLLVNEVERLQNSLATIFAENDSVTNPEPIDLYRPLERAVIYMDPSEKSVALPWQRLRLVSFRDRYEEHRIRLADTGLANFESAPPRLPIDLTREEVMKMLANHRKVLVEKMEELSKPFLEALNDG
jgi:hypothetical protein